jgi:hypothetical protein
LKPPQHAHRPVGRASTVGKRGWSPSAGHTPDHERLLLDRADELGLLVTGGSDAHDATERPMGAAGVDDGELDALLARLRRE